ncbi:ATP-binding protein [Mesorhizobium sp. M4B.F.Ca.ET.049.02.1.2]|uniref:ATP-binding protein n=1 Tax=Mesorhizobium sp. M4B.F.Ca.ET.049.02.1.2 TaxID=2496752 RepID=UPI000FCBB048|nr:ATP-binding protein [Mesorhizobium sp. M4B.F.Ca.ET.049.02.1.2]RUW75204.1 ATP-binding protein [Mesorhizobium sp. M4B.F.Ca.ET.049.02.1.2]
MNAFQAIQDAGSKHEHSIVIECEREADLVSDDLAPFVRFTVRDTGVGFNDANFDSFNTAFSEYKYERGGKGLGRIMWLVAFDRAEIDSVFVESDTSHPWRRTFTFDTAYDPDQAPPVAIDAGAPGTTVTLSGFKSPYRKECPRAVEALAQRLIEHFILVLLRPDCPKIELRADGQRHSVNAIFRDYYQANASETMFSLSGADFTLHGFKITSPRANKHRLIYAANSRGVLTENLDDHIPNLSTKLIEDDGSQFVYLAIVQGQYLDQKVNNYRTDFDISGAESADADNVQLSLIPSETISKADIRTECVAAINEALSHYIQALNDAKIERIYRYVKDEAPQYKPLMRYKDNFINKIPPNVAKIDLEMALHRELHQREVEIKRESSKMITGAEKIEDYDAYRQRLSDFIERYSELGTAALAHHVMHRKIIIDFLEKAISINEKTGKYPLEQVVHNIIFPMRSTDRETLYSQQNLWIIDERLTFHTYIASDKQINTFEGIENDSARRPDIAIFDRKITFSEPVEDASPLNSVVVVEFKKPQRDDYSDEKNPILQVFDQINEIRAGLVLNDAGRPIRPANSMIPAFAYVICDITPKLDKVLKNSDATPTPDGLAYYGYHRNHQIYYEVIDYGKIVSDAKKRNRIFFERLSINSLN